MSQRHERKCRASGGKICFPDRGRAISRAEFVMATNANRDLRLYVYECPYCRTWHMTRKTATPKTGDQPMKL